MDLVMVIKCSHQGSIKLMEECTWTHHDSKMECTEGAHPIMDRGTQTKSINLLPTEILREILLNLPQKDLVRGREVCKRWRDAIDQHCPMKCILLDKNDKFLEKRVNLRMSCCFVRDFLDSPNISLTHPESIRSIKFCGGCLPEINVENARGLLIQVKPFVHSLTLDIEYLKNKILFEPDQFPKVRKLTIEGVFENYNASMHDNFEIVSFHRFPLLESVVLQVAYQEKYLMEEGLEHFFEFLTRHRQTIKHLSIDIYCLSHDYFSRDASQKFTLSKEVIKLLCKELQLETLDLVILSKYLPAWTPILQNQKKLVELVSQGGEGAFGPGRSVPFYTICPAIASSFSTLRTVALYNICSVGYDGIWAPLDLSVFRQVVNLTHLELERMGGWEVDHGSTSKSNYDQGTLIQNLESICSASLKELFITQFVCKSEELLTLVEKAGPLEYLSLEEVRAPPTSPLFASTGVHGGIIHTFMKKEVKKFIRVNDLLNDSDPTENDKLEAALILYPAAVCRRDPQNRFYCHF